MPITATMPWDGEMPATEKRQEVWSDLQKFTLIGYSPLSFDAGLVTPLGTSEDFLIVSSKGADGTVVANRLVLPSKSILESIVVAKDTAFAGTNPWANMILGSTVGGNDYAQITTYTPVIDGHLWSGAALASGLATPGSVGAGAAANVHMRITAGAAQTNQTAGSLKFVFTYYMAEGSMIPDTNFITQTANVWQGHSQYVPAPRIRWDEMQRRTLIGYTSTTFSTSAINQVTNLMTAPGLASSVTNALKVPTGGQILSVSVSPIEDVTSGGAPLYTIGTAASETQSTLTKLLLDGMGYATANAGGAVVSTLATTHVGGRGTIGVPYGVVGEDFVTIQNTVAAVTGGALKFAFTYFQIPDDGALMPGDAFQYSVAPAMSEAELFTPVPQLPDSLRQAQTWAGLQLYTAIGYSASDLTGAAASWIMTSSGVVSATAGALQLPAKAIPVAAYIKSVVDFAGAVATFDIGTQAPGPSTVATLFDAGTVAGVNAGALVLGNTSANAEAGATSTGVEGIAAGSGYVSITPNAALTAGTLKIAITYMMVPPEADYISADNFITGMP